MFEKLIKKIKELSTKQPKKYENILIEYQRKISKKL